MQIAWISCWIAIGLLSAGDAKNEKDGFTKRGPLDKHAGLVQQVLDTLNLEPQQKKQQLQRIVAEGHAAWRVWFRKNHEKVDAYNKAIQAAKASGDKKELNKVRKEKKVFMHTAPSLLRKPEPVRAALTEEQRKLFDERLLKLKRDLHRPAKKKKAPMR